MAAVVDGAVGTGVHNEHHDQQIVCLTGYLMRHLKEWCSRAYMIHFDIKLLLINVFIIIETKSLS